MAVAWWLPSIHQADEVYQVAEQAHRAVHGYGVISWEFQTASRAAVLPTVVIPIYRLGLLPAASQTLVAAVFSLFSLLPVWIAYRWGARAFGTRWGLLAGALTGTWFELVYFAPKPTADIVGGYLLLASIFFLLTEGGAGARRLGGACLALAVGVRLQVAPAAAAILIWSIASDRRRIGAVAMGLTIGAAIIGVEEWRWWGAPFLGHWNYLKMEFIHHASRNFAREPVTFYAKNAILIYGGALPVMLALAAAGTRRAPALLVCAAAVLVPFHFIGHKEYRFVTAALPALVVLMSLGAVGLLARLESRTQRRATVLAVAGWLLAMAAMSFSDTYRPNWTLDRNHIFAFRDIGAQDDACGVALVNIRWPHTPGYAGLGRDIPMYEVRSDADARRLEASANYILAGTKAPPPPAPFIRWREYVRPVQYVYKRPGGCVPDPSSAVEKPPLIPGLQ